MAAAFNLTAQINLQGPTNLKPIVANIKKELSGIKATVDIDVKASSAKNITAINSKLKELTKFATSANASIKDLNSSLSSLANSLNKVGTSGSSTSAGIESTNSSLKTTKKALSEATTEIEEFGKQSGLAIRRFAAFSTVTTVVYSVVNAFSSAFKEFVTFNKEIVRLSQVTGQSVAELSSVTDEITRLSTGLGVASSDLLVVSTTLAQAGLSAEDTRVALEALAKSSLAPSFDDLTSTTEGSIAVLRQFGLQASELEGALGSINAVSAAFAVEASDLITAIQRTGGVFASSSRGVSEGKDALNEFLAVFTSVRQTTRESAETIATGLRTIFSRIQRRETIDALKQYGVELTDLEGKFVGPFEAVKRLSDGLNRLDPRSLDFSGITEELGGFRQIGKVIPLIQQFAVAQEALKVAQKGQDSLAQDAAVAQESLANRFIKTRESFVALVRDIGDSTTFKALTEVTFTLANGLITLTKALEPLLPLLVTFGAIKIGSGLTQFASGFGRGFGGGGNRGGGTSPTPTSPGPSAPSGTPKNDALLANNTTALSSLLGPINSLLQSINMVNGTLNQTNVLLKARPGVKGFARGGFVPGSGNRDTVPAMLTPGEFVLRKKAVQALGLGRLKGINRYAGGGKIKKNRLFDMFDPQKFADGGIARILRQNVIAAAILKDSNFSRERLDNSKRKILRSAGSYLNDNERAILSNYDLVREGVNPDLRANFTTSIRRGLVAGVESAIRSATKDIGLPTIKISRNRDNFSNFFKSINDASLGNLFEDVLATIEKSGVFPTAENPRRPFDFTTGLQSALAQRLFPNISSSNIQYVDAKASSKAAGPSAMLNKLIDQIKLEHPGGPISSTVSAPGTVSTVQDAILRDLTRSGASGRTLTDLKQSMTISSNFKKLISQQLLEEMALSQLVKKSGNKWKLRQFAKGGSISSKDTVPALLTPGEFVINKRAAQRIGYGNLRRLNYADKIRGYNKGGVVGAQRLNSGGVVQRFADGGVVDISILSGIIVSVLQPQIEKLASSFKDFDGTISDTAMGFAKSLQELSSSVSSSAIALSVIGASTSQRRSVVGLAAATGGIGGAISGFNTQKLEDAVQKNTNALNSFQSAITNFQQSSSFEASEDVQKKFALLTKTLESTNKSITSAETWKNFGDALTSASATTLAVQTGLIALSSAINSTTASIQASNASGLLSLFSNKKKPTAVPDAMGFAADAAKGDALAAFLLERQQSLAKSAAGAASSLGFVAKAATLAKGGLGILVRGLPYIGLVVTGLQLIWPLFKLLGNNMNQAAKDAAIFSDALKKSTAANRDVQVTNKRYRDEVLRDFQELKRTKSTEEVKQVLGSISTTPVPGSLSQNIKIGRSEFTFVINELNSTLRTAFAEQARERGIFIDSALSIKDSIQQLKDFNLSDQADQLVADLPKVFEKYLKGQFVAARVAENPNVTTEAAGKEFIRLFNSGATGIQTIIGVVERFGGAVEFTKQNLDLAQLAAREVSIKFANLSQISDAVISSLGAMSTEIENNNRKLQESVSLLQGQAQVSNSNTFRRNAQVLSNVRGFSAQQVASAFEATIRSITPPQDSQNRDRQLSIINELKSGFSVLRTLESSLPTLLNNIQLGPNAGDGEGLKLFESAIKNILEESAGVSKEIAGQIALDISKFVGEEQGKGGVTAQQIIEKFGSLNGILQSAIATQKFATAVNEEAAKVMDIVNQNANEAAQALAKASQLQLKVVQSQQETASEITKILGQEISSINLERLFQEQVKTLSGGFTGIDNLDKEATNLRNTIKKTREQIDTPNQTPEQIAILKQQELEQVVRYNKVFSALELISNSSERLRSAFDRLIEKEKKLFSGPQSVFEEFLKDPIKAQEIAKILEGPLSRLKAGTATQTDIGTIFNSDLFRLLEATGNQRDIEEIKRSARLQTLAVAGLEAVLTRDSDGIQAVLSQGFRELASASPIAKSIGLAPEIQAVNDLDKQRNEATLIFNRELTAAAALLGSEGISKPLSDLNDRLPGIIATRVQEELDYINTIKELRARELAATTTQEATSTPREIPIAVLQTSVSKFNEIIDKLNTTILVNSTGKSPNIPKIPETGNFSDLLSIVTTQILPALITLQRKGVTIRPGQQDLFTPVSAGSDLLADSIKEFVQQVRVFNQIFQKQSDPSISPSGRDFLMKPGGGGGVKGNIGEQGSRGQSGVSQGSFDTSQLKNTFNGFISSLSETLTASGETFGDNLILRLNGVFGSFDKTVSNFKSSSETLVAKLNDFNARGGIKGPNIPQEVSVKVGFDEELTVVAQNNNNTQLVDNIGQLVYDTVSARLRELRVFG